MFKKIFFILILTTLVFSCNKTNETVKKDKNTGKSTKDKKVIKTKKVIKDEIIFKAKFVIDDDEFLKKLLESFRGSKLLPIPMLEILKNLKEINFYLTKNKISKLEVKGIDFIKIGLDSKKLKEDKIQKKGDFKYYLDKDKEYILISMKDKTIFAYNMSLEDALKESTPPLSEDLEKYSKMLKNSSLYIMLKKADFMNLKILPHSQYFKSGIILQSIKDNMINLNIISYMEKDTSDLSEELNKIYNKLKPQLFQSMNQYYNNLPKEFLPQHKEALLKMMKSILNNLSISSDKNILKLSTKIPAKKETVGLLNVTVIGMISAVAIPAYMNYVKKLRNK